LKALTFQCQNCRVQTSLIAGTLFQNTPLALTRWFWALYLISQAKTGLSALAVKRHLGVSYPTAWLIQHKRIQTMTERDAQYTLCGEVLVDDAYLGGNGSVAKSVGVRRTKSLSLPPFPSTPRGIRSTPK